MADIFSKNPDLDVFREIASDDFYGEDDENIGKIATHPPSLLSQRLNPAAGVCFRGIVEKLHDDFLKNGLLKARIPLLHLDSELKNIPYAQVTQTLLSWCNTWKEPKMNNNKMHLKASGDGKIDGDLELKNLQDPGGYLVARATVSQAPSPFGQVGFGSMGSGPTSNKGKSAISGNCEVDIKTDDYKTCEITPKQYELRPYNFHREGENLIRVGDEVLLVAIMGDIRDLVVVDIIKFKK